MKTTLSVLLAVLLSASGALAAQVISGTITSINVDGSLTIRAGNPARLFTLKGLKSAPVYTVSGESAEVLPQMVGTQASVYFEPERKQWRIVRVTLPDPPRMPLNYRSPLPPFVVYTEAWRDRDITTQPGSKAAVDNDITTKPSGTAAFDGDRTTVDARRDPMRDFDITTNR